MGERHPSLQQALGGPHSPRPGGTALPWEKDMAVTAQVIPEASRCRPRGWGRTCTLAHLPRPSQGGKWDVSIMKNKSAHSLLVLSRPKKLLLRPKAQPGQDGFPSRWKGEGPAFPPRHSVLHSTCSAHFTEEGTEAQVPALPESTLHVSSAVIHWGHVLMSCWGRSRDHGEEKGRENHGRRQAKGGHGALSSAPPAPPALSQQLPTQRAEPSILLSGHWAQLPMFINTHLIRSAREAHR